MGLFEKKYKKYKCKCGETIKVLIGYYDNGGTSGQATCKCGARMIIN